MKGGFQSYVACRYDGAGRWPADTLTKFHYFFAPETRFILDTSGLRQCRVM